MKSKSILIIFALLVGIATILGWAFEIPEVDGTLGADELLTNSAFYGSILGGTIGFALSFTAKTGIGRFQAVGSSIVLCTAAVALLAHYTNRTLGGDDAVETVPLRVREVTAFRSGRGITREALNGPPEGYYVFVETPEGPVRLQHAGEQPNVGPDRSINVLRRPGYWGYPRYEISPPK